MKAVSDFLMLYEQYGVFSYEDDGFIIQLAQGAKKYFYGGIEAIIAYKVDRVLYDEIRLEVVFAEFALRISEEIPGWYQFVQKIKEIFPSISRTWDLEMPFPSFAMNLTVLYQRPGGY
jgi:hypothetical protein